MAYCSDCGSKVAENDVFCPYCGISLQPITLADIDDSQDSTNVSQASDNAQPDENIVTESAAAGENFVAKVTDDYSNDITAEKINPITDSIKNKDFDAESPEKIEAIEPAGEALPIDNEEKIASLGKGGNQNVEVTSGEQANIISSIGQKEVVAESQNESSIMNYEEVEVKEGKDFEEIELTGENSSPKNDDDADFTATIPYIPKETVKSGAIPSQISDAKQEKLNVNQAATSQNELESVNSSVDPIVKPNIELESPGEKFPPSRFDSVRIMERKERISEKPAKIVSQPQTEQKENRSFTTPNIGGNDTQGKKSAKLKPLEEGTVLNERYEIVRKIGGGGMGAVYLASDKNLGGVLRAVKEMVQSYIEGEQQEKAVNDFKRESLLLTSLEHQSIPTIYDYFYDETEARFYLVMKYISGGDLASRIRSTPEGRIEEQSVTEWAIQVADVLDYLHNRQPPIVYRDLKPANIMIDGNSGRVMLIDFGIARWVNKEEKGVTAVGTMGYAPPELFSGNVEPRSDIYSLGSTMFHLLTGADPQSNPLLIFDFQKHPRPRQINPQLSDQMERILMRAVEYNADKRFASAAELRGVLEDHLKKLKENKATFGVKAVPASVSLSEQPVFCGFCGQKIVATDLFCAFCGAKQPLAQQGVQSRNYTSAPLTAQLLIVGTNELEVPAFRIEKDETLVGRRDPMSNIFPEVDLSKFDPQTKISRKHARIWREGDKFIVEDLGSSNGTIVLPVVNETVRLQPHQPYVLTNGDKLKLGDTTLHFVVG